MQNLESGIVIKLLSAEGYGFIETNHDKRNVFFHKSDVNQFATLKQGDFVQFTLVDTPKGKAAKNITCSPSSVLRQIAKAFTFTRDAVPKNGYVIESRKVQTNWFCDPTEGKARLAQMAKDAGCNAVLNMTCERREIQKAYNYFGTVHSYSADIAIVVEDVTVQGNNIAARQKACDDEIARRFALSTAAAKQRAEEQLKRQKGKDKSFATIAFGLLMFASFMVFAK